MKKLATLALALSLAVSAQGKCVTSDAWTGVDKDYHATVGLVAGFTGAQVFDSFWGGVAAAAALGALKEYTDAQNPREHSCSLQDLLVTTAGGALGAGANRLIIRFGDGGKSLNVTYQMGF